MNPAIAMEVAMERTRMTVAEMITIRIKKISIKFKLLFNFFNRGLKLWKRKLIRCLKIPK